MLAHRLRRRATIKTTLGQRLGFAGKASHNLSSRTLANLASELRDVNVKLACVENGGQPLNQHWINVSCLLE